MIRIMRTKDANSVVLNKTKVLKNSKLLSSKILISWLAFASVFLEMALKFQWLVLKCLCAGICYLFNSDILG